jgi:hypothetical protein
VFPVFDYADSFLLGIGDVRISPFMQIAAGDMAVSFLLFTSLRLGQRAQIYTSPLGDSESIDSGDGIGGC